MGALLENFIAETLERLEQLDRDLMRLELNPQSPELLGNIFHTFHAIKETSAAFGFMRMRSLAHITRNIVGKFCEGTISPTPQAITYILDTVDLLKIFLSEIESVGVEPAGSDDEIKNQLQSLEMIQAIPERKGTEIIRVTGTDAPNRNDNEGVFEEEFVSLLIFGTGDQNLKAIPFALISHVEAIDLEDIERAPTGPVIHYQGRRMPLMTFDESDNLKGYEGERPLLVFKDSQQWVGVVVDDIYDIIDDKFLIQMKPEEESFLGRTTIGGKITEIINPDYFLCKVFPNWMAEDERARALQQLRAQILLVDNGVFSRNLLTRLLRASGAIITTCASAGKALELLNQGNAFDGIFIDIETPEINEFKFIQAMRSRGVCSNAPLFALISQEEMHDVEVLQGAGFSDYIAKSDHEKIFDILKSIIPKREKSYA